MDRERVLPRVLTLRPLRSLLLRLLRQGRRILLQLPFLDLGLVTVCF